MSPDANWTSKRLIRATIVAPLAAIVVATSGCNDDRPPAATAVDRLFALAGEDAEQRMRLFHTTRENAIAECMDAAGFVYTPELFSRRSLVTDPAQLAILTVDRATEVAYGVEAGAIFINEIPASENDQRRAAMDVAEQVAYEQALFGGSGDMEAEPSGCVATAEVIVSAEFDDYLDARELAAANELLEEYISRFEQQTEDVWETWSTCMSEAGFEFSTTFDARTEVQDRFGRGDLDLDNGDLHEYEFRVAIADALCQEPHLDELHALSRLAQEAIFGRAIETDP